MVYRVSKKALSCAVVSALLSCVAAGCDDDGGDGTDTVDAGNPGDGDVGDGDAGDGDVGDGDAGPVGDGDAGDGDVGDGDGDAGPGDGDGDSDASVGDGDGDMSDAGDSDAEVPVTGDTWGITSTGRLVHFDRASGALESAVAVTGLNDGETLHGADVRPADGLLYGVTSESRLVTIDPTSGVATLKSTLSVSLAGSWFGVDFNPVADRLRIVSDTAQNLRVNVDTGAATEDAALNPGTPMVTAAGYTNSFASACRTRLYVVDTAAKALYLQDPPNDGKLGKIGDLAADVTGIDAFEIATGSDGTNTAFVAANKDGVSWILDLDLGTGAAVNPRAVALESGETLVGMTVSPPAEAPAQARGDMLGVTVANRLVSFNRTAPGKLCTNVAITGLGDGENVLGGDTRPATGDFYALGSTGKLYTLDLDTGAATLASTLTTSLSGTEFSVGFNPVPDRLRVISDGGQNLRINVADGATTADSALTPITAQVTAVAYTNSFAGAKSTTLYGIDSTLDSLVLVGGNPATGGACPDLGNPNCGVVTTVGALNVGDVTAVNGFDIDAKTGTALAALVIAPATTSTLYQIDLSTGAATLPTGVSNGTIGGSAALRALSFAATPMVTAYGLTEDNVIVTFALATPTTPTVTSPITGLEADEDILGIDVRPADGKLYGIGSSERLYLLDPATGAATRVTTLDAGNGDDAPFTGFAADDYGVDFNPAADLLRAVSAANDNLRIVPSSRAALTLGEVYTDTALNPSDPAVTAAAYTNSFAGTTKTTLYVIDSSTDTLYTQGGADSSPSPNTGTLNSIGALGIDATGDVGFDVVGGHNGLALAVVRTSGESSELYSIRLSTGAATAFNASNNTVGDGSLAPLRGVALDLK